MKNRWLHYVALLVLLLLQTSCGDRPTPAAQSPAESTTQPSQQEGVFRSLSPLEAKTLMESRKDLLLIDVRGPDELWQGSIPGSQLVPFSEIAQGRMTLPTNRPLLLICAVGGRSYAVGRYFAARGYPEIYNLSGGISAWKEAGLPLARR